ncbi:putative Ig domain-containing protein [Actinospica durhamensis]|uniref:phospholipase D n=1 Tax=Actinospica durhamensis TaxID=1508375 RepID=A0A941EXX6_9ACTN|nr:phospholipase D-like domain-containing protein [Actinospica durhamensis]MBR7839061.1 putative Ig domain-containing protein [Actinospica durhamensis]
MIRRLGLILAAGATAAATALATAPAHAASGTYSLLILPDQGESTIYSFVNSATSSIDMTMYELRDTTMENDLIAREKAGVNVRVILDRQETSVNAAAYSALQAGGVSVTYSSTSFTYTHQKTVTVDNDESYISTGNLDTTYYSTSRDFGVFDTDQNDVSAIVAVFNADFAKTSITPGDGDDLVWSPTDSQTKIVALLNGAQHTLDIEQEEFSDTAEINAIVAAAKRGVTVRAVLENESNEWATGISEIEAAGAKVTTYTSSTGFYVHAKTVVADYGTSTAKVFLGSENMTDNSLNSNRELGLIVSDSGVLSGVESTFNTDFGSTGTTGSVSVTNPGSQTGTVGTAASLQISATDTAGGTLSYAATGLPTGLSISASTGAISGTPTTAGTYSATVTATDSTGPSASASFTWTISAAGGGGTGCTAAQLLGNPGFETGTAAPWTASSGVIADNSKEPPHSGTWDAWLDGYGKTTTDTLSQSVAVPSGCTTYSFTFYMHIDTAETSTTTAYDTLKLQVLNSSGTVLQTLYTYSNLNAATGYSLHTFTTLGTYAGQTITIKFTGTEDSEYQTSFVIDDTAFNVS